MRYIIAIQAWLLAYALCNITDYTEQRARILKTESRLTLGGNIALTDKESIVNVCLMQHKFNEIDYGFDNPQYFNFSYHYFTYKDKIKKSKVFKIIKAMPKGAVLHVHDMSLLGSDYHMKLTYLDKLYVCFDKQNVLLKFANVTPTDVCSDKWKLMSEARNSSSNITKFDADLRKHFTMVVDNPDIVYPTIKDTWTTFMNYFRTVYQMLTYRPIWEQYFYDALTKYKEDNIMYVEVRSVLPKLYDLDGTVYEQLITALAYKKVIKRFLKENPDFIGVKLIFAPSRKVNRAQLAEYLLLAKKIKDNIADIFAGFDLVGQEDLGNPLVEFVPELIDAAPNLNYFFHAGETDWYGTLTDENLLDAILLGAKRLGHAYALPKHPYLMQEVLKRDIGLEVNILSNTVLSLVRDVRNHPLSAFLANGLPVVLSSDDPGAWDAEPLSEDFYVAFVGAASKLSDLRVLKALAMNSLKYSALEPRKKTQALKRFNDKWNEFINNFDCSLY